MRDDDFTRSAKVVRVVDGDTIVIDVDLGFSIWSRQVTRVYGIDTPEVYGVKRDSDEYARGKAASERMKELLEPGSEILIRTHKEKGKYGRYIAEILNEDGFNVGDQLVAEGHAVRKNYD